MSERYGFTTSTTRKGLQQENKRFLCAPPLWEMLDIVKDLRRQQ